MATTEDRGAADSVGAWRDKVYDRAPERSDELFSTISGVENEPLYAQEGTEVDYARDLGFPGAPESKPKSSSKSKSNGRPPEEPPNIRSNISGSGNRPPIDWNRSPRGPVVAIVVASSISWISST